MRVRKLVCTLLLVLTTLSAGAASRDDREPRNAFQKIVKLIKHIVALDDGSEIHPPIG